jgi:hypothetical protein
MQDDPRVGRGVAVIDDPGGIDRCQELDPLEHRIHHAMIDRDRGNVLSEECGERGVLLPALLRVVEDEHVAGGAQLEVAPLAGDEQIETSIRQQNFIGDPVVRDGNLQSQRLVFVRQGYACAVGMAQGVRYR